MNFTQRLSLIYRHAASMAIAMNCLLAVPVFAASGGELDMTFAPVAADVPADASVRTVGRDVFVISFGTGLLHFQDDGTLDTAFRLSAPVGTPLKAAAPFAYGGWAVLGLGREFEDFADGTYRRLPVVGLDLPLLFPQDNGSVLYPTARRPLRSGQDGLLDPTYARLIRLAAGVNLGVVQAAACDRQGRLILGGNFRSTGSGERLGLLRLRPDGALDTSWNPAPSIGIQTLGTTGLNAIPIFLSTAPDGSVMAVMQFQSTNGINNLHIAAIDSSGTVTASFPSDPNVEYVPPLAQPDGKILVAGVFTNWLGHPATGLVRLNSDGSYDPSFDVQLSHTNSYYILSGMSLDDQGRLVIAGGFEAVNGVSRPGLARVYAYDPAPSFPSAFITVSQPHIATNETLYLTAAVSGSPPPDLQWYRNGVLIPGATNRGLRVVVTGPNDVGDFRLVAGNTVGSTNLDFPTVSIAVPSPIPGTSDPSVVWPLTNFTRVDQLVPLANGGILVGGGIRGGSLPNHEPMVGRLLSDGSLDQSFGAGGLVSGNGFVENLRQMSDGHVLVAGSFDELAGQPVSGLAELDSNGALVARSFPSLDVAHVSVALPLPAGGYQIAGSFSKVNGVTASHLARLTASLELDETFHSPLQWWQFVDDMALDQQGRLLIGGAQSIPPTGLMRLLPDGSLDPGFTPDTNSVRSIFVEPGGTLLVGPPFRRLSGDGALLLAFDSESPQSIILNLSNPDHTQVRFPDGAGVFPLQVSGFLTVILCRWQADGSRDFRFKAVFNSSELEAAVLLPDTSLLLSVRQSISTPTIVRSLIRIPPDSDSRLLNPRILGSQLQVDLATQPGRHYEIRRTSDLGTTNSTLVTEIDGDGYIQEISTDADAGTLFLQLSR